MMIIVISKTKTCTSREVNLNGSKTRVKKPFAMKTTRLRYKGEELIK